MAKGRDLQSEQRVEVPVEFQVARDEGPRQTQFTRSTQHADQGVGRQDLEGQPVGGRDDRRLDDTPVERLHAEGQLTVE